MINVLDSDKTPIQCRVLLDTCSTANFITERLSNKLKLSKRKCSIPVGAFGDLSTHTNHLITAKIQSSDQRYEREFQFFTIPTICGLTPIETIPRDNLQIPRNVKLADPEFYKPRPVDMLLGSGPSLSLLSSGQYHLSDIILQKTRLGWVVGGNVPTNTGNKRQQAFQININCDLTRFWEIEEGPQTIHWSPEEQAAEDNFKLNYSRDGNGRYTVALPFKSNNTTLGESKEIALKRFKSLERKFERNPDFKQQYFAVMEEYITLHHMSKVSHTNSPGYYLPHHAVIKESSTTTKLRVVFDGSAKTSNGRSLNETLLVGPTIQDDLLSLILRFRTHQYVITGDIKQMYRQFLLRPEDRRFQRILWRDENNDIATYELNTVTFGLSAAPFLAIRSLQQLARDEESIYPVAANILQNDMYVDDLLSGFDEITEGLRARDQISKLLARGQLHIRQWASNDPQLLRGLPPESINRQLQLNSDKTLKTLGLSWNSDLDSITYTVKSIKLNSTITKRTILSDIATIFDPLGLLGPVILKAKTIIQKLWAAKIDWDESIPINIQTLWFDLCTQLPLLNHIQFNRKVIQKHATEIQIHGFCDASEGGYGACLYIKTIDPQEQHQVKLLCSKSRIAPLKSVSIPRLELCAAHTLAILYTAVIKAINIPITKTILWSDSMIALHWIHSSPHTLKTFVQNRVSEIQSKTKNCQWKHVPSGDNPADALSRGQLPSEFINNQIWQNGPSWLKEPEDYWPNQSIQKPTDNSETRQATCLQTTLDSSIFKQFNSFNKLIRIYAYCFRLAAIIKRKPRWQGKLTLEELRDAHNRIIRLVQEAAISEEIQSLKNKPTQTPRSKRLIQLNPFLDDQGLVRVGGRLQNAAIPFSQQHPIILPQNHIITELIIREEHIGNAHAGIQTTLNIIRLKYWILDGRNQVRKVIRNCVTCRRANPSTTHYMMGNLPAARVSQTIRPFVNVGVDYCGPFYIKEKKYRNKNRIKVYIAVFVCLTTKAVHMEVVSDLTSAGFIAALERFIARRGKPAIIQSDNGTNFVGSNNELREIIKELEKSSENEKIAKILHTQGIKWQFTPPASPHFGGIWEAAVKSFKHHLIRVMGQNLLTFEELNTLTIKIEGILNSRPITAMSSDPNDLQALTPGHFLIGDTLLSVPELNLTEEKLNKLSRWQLIQRIKQEFWARWHKEYLNELNIRRKWTTGNHDIQQNSIVLLKEDNLPPMQWRLGRVIDLHPGTDNVVRVVTVKTAKGVMKRNVRKLAPLPVSSTS